jgi:multidrug efflux pump subunit AcrA (membrane-fusion protein)
VVRASDEISVQTRTVGIVAAVEGSYEKAVPGKRPPLTKGMFVEVELRGPKIDNQIVVPRSALHGDVAYIADGEGRLEIRPVTTGLVQGDAVVVEEGLSAGDILIVSDLTPALPGMLLRTVPDDDLAAELAAQAAGSETAGSGL